MKTALLSIGLLAAVMSYAQHDDRITTLDFVQILDDNKDEAMHYYLNNWKVLREMAIDRDLIHSFQLMETPYDEEQPYHLILMTTYANHVQYEQRENNFAELIKDRGPLKLLNDKQPKEFRKNLFYKELVRHYD